MTLEEKIRPHTKAWDCYNDEPLQYNHTGKVLKIVDEFAINFANWYEEEILAKGDYNMIDKPKKELLEMYKKEVGL